MTSSSVIIFFILPAMVLLAIACLVQSLSLHHDLHQRIALRVIGLGTLIVVVWRYVDRLSA